MFKVTGPMFLFKATYGWDAPVNGKFKVYLKKITPPFEFREVELNETHYEGFKKWTAGGGTVQDCLKGVDMYTVEMLMSGMNETEQRKFFGG
jgi:hypothetical protein